MKENVFRIGTDEIGILDVDLNIKGEFIAITGKGSVITNAQNEINIDVELRYPLIRYLKTGFLLVDALSKGEPNAFIFNSQGRLINSFFVGDGVEDIIVRDEKIVVGYFDEGVFGAKGPNNDGLAVFDNTGLQVFGFNAIGKEDFIADCYCMCELDDGGIYFYVYPEFDMYRIDVSTLEVRALTPPSGFEGAGSVTAVKGGFIFHGSYDDKLSFFHWTISGNKVCKLGEYAGHLRGILHGKFISVSPWGYSIIDPLQR